MLSPSPVRAGGTHHEPPGGLILADKAWIALIFGPRVTRRRHFTAVFFRCWAKPLHLGLGAFQWTGLCRFGQTACSWRSYSWLCSHRTLSFCHSTLTLFGISFLASPGDLCIGLCSLSPFNQDCLCSLTLRAEKAQNWPSRLLFLSSLPSCVTSWV